MVDTPCVCTDTELEIDFYSKRHMAKIGKPIKEIAMAIEGGGPRGGTTVGFKTPDRVRGE